MQAAAVPGPSQSQVSGARHQRAGTQSSGGLCCGLHSMACHGQHILLILLCCGGGYYEHRHGLCMECVWRTVLASFGNFKCVCLYSVWGVGGDASKQRGHMSNMIPRALARARYHTHVVLCMIIKCHDSGFRHASAVPHPCPIHAPCASADDGRCLHLSYPHAAQYCEQKLAASEGPRGMHH